MGRFAKLNKDISTLGIEVLQNQELCKLLHYPHYDPWSMPEVDGYEHVYNQRLLLFTPKIFDADDVGSYLIIRPDKIRPTSGGYFRATFLLFDIMVHQAARRVKGGDRVMYIADIIEDMMSNARLSVGKANFHDCVTVANTNGTFSGFSLVYKDVDFK